MAGADADCSHHAVARHRSAAAPLFSRARALEAGLPEPARSLLRQVNARDMAGLGLALRPFLDSHSADPWLSPVLNRHPGTKVSLHHGIKDAVVFRRRGRGLASQWAPLGPTRLLVTPRIGHAETGTSPSLREDLRLLGFWQEVLAR